MIDVRDNRDIPDIDDGEKLTRKLGWLGMLEQHPPCGTGRREAHDYSPLTLSNQESAEIAHFFAKAICDWPQLDTVNWQGPRHMPDRFES